MRRANVKRKVSAYCGSVRRVKAETYHASWPHLRERKDERAEDQDRLALQQEQELKREVGDLKLDNSSGVGVDISS